MRDGKLLFSAVSFLSFGEPGDKMQQRNAKALDSLRHVVIGNEPLAAKVAAAAEHPNHCPEVAGRVLFSPSLR